MTGVRNLPARPAAAFLAAVAVYFTVQTLLRTLYAHSAGLDEAEILITAQSAAWGHGSQPPLYNWLQIAAFGLFGTNLFALAVVKNVLLGLFFIFMFLTGRIVLEDDRKAALTAFALFTVPQIAWESQRALTHTVVALTVTAATLYVLLRVLRDGRWTDYLLLGICIGLGAMSKYNFVIAVTAFLLAAVSVAELRPRMLSPRMPAALGVAVLVALPHALWVADNVGRTLSRTRKFQAASESAFSIEPAGALLTAALAYGTLPLAVFGTIGAIAWFRGRGPEKVRPARSPLRRFILRIIPIGLALVLTGVLVAGATEIRDRWMSPLLFVLPLTLFILIEDRLTPRLAGVVKNISLALGLIAMAALAVHHLAPDLRRKAPEANHPFGAFAERIRALGFQRGTIIADGTFLGGSLKLQFPDSLVVEPQYGVLAAPAVNAPVLAVWRANTPPDDVRDLYRTVCAAPLPDAPAVTLAAPYEHGAREYSVQAAMFGPCPPR